MKVKRHRVGAEKDGLRTVLSVQAGALSVLVMVVLTACTGASSPAPSPRGTSGCTASPPASSANALPPELTDKLAEYGIWSQTWNSPPTEEDLAHPAVVPAGVDPSLNIWKSPILVAPGVIGTVSIVSPRSAKLFVTTWAKWEHLTGPEILAQQTSRVTVTGCSGIASYPGLTIVKQPICVVFGVQRQGDPETKVSVPFFGGRC